MRFNLMYSLAAMVLLACHASKNTGSNLPVSPDNIVIAHRGAFKKLNHPENSIASLETAIRLKCAGSEFDVRMTSDDSLVINHDPDFKGLEIEKRTYAELLKFPLSNGEKIPTLREYLLAGMQKNNHTKLICEIKPSGISKERGKQIAVKVVSLVNVLGAAKMTEYISFDYDILLQVLAIEKTAITFYLAGDKNPTQLKSDGISGADYHFSVFRNHPDWIQKAKEHKIFLNAWTVNSPEDMDWLIAEQFDFITTNEPELLLERLGKPGDGKAWKLVWSDEFIYNGLPDSSKWSYETGGHGWGNNELQYYTKADSSNAKVSNGVLKITTQNKKRDENEYTSARLVTMDKAEFTYGRIEIKAKLAPGRGIWPAIWMLGSDIETAGWPASGEIDIMEHVGFEPDTVLSTVHTDAYNHVKKTQVGKKIFINKPYETFHLYAIEWTTAYIDFFVDDQKILRFSNENKSNAEWPFNKPFYLVLNIAVGGNLGGQKGIDNAAFPSSMEVDYVRVYK